MRIVQPSATLEWATPSPALAIERAARTCYRSEGRICDGSAATLIASLIRRGHEAMLEHASASIRFVTDRAIANELTRHRLASFAQVSTRYVKVGELEVVEPPELDAFTIGLWIDACRAAELGYQKMIARGCRPEIARSVLPLCTATEVVCAANFREWRHILRLRLDRAAHPQMREIMAIAEELLRGVCPEVFGEADAG